jgi:hypothetical protein
MKVCEAVIWGTELDWIIARPTRLTDGPKTGKFQVSPRLAPNPGTGAISRADLAAFMLEQVSSDQWLHNPPTLAY